MITHVTHATKSCDFFFDCCSSVDSESDSADSAAADIDEPASGSNRIEPDLAPEGEVEDSRASADIEPGQAFEGGVEDSRAPPVIGLEHASEGKLRTQGRQIMGKTARMIWNMMAFGTAFTPTSQTSMVS